MTSTTQSPTTIRSVAVVMFAVADQDAALRFYTEKLGFEVRGDDRFGPNMEFRWLEVAPPGSRARIALNPPMDGTRGGSTVGVETPDVRAEHARLRAMEGVDVDAELMPSMPGAPQMFSLRDPDGNALWVVEEPAAS
jgi:catechol 2,3-dioxygenase-like lactoylglutathione lyase family enzyme